MNLSNCCGAAVKVDCADEGTCCHLCEKCGQACDLKQKEAMKKYNIIYADPAWSYRDKRDKHTRMCGGALSHYPTMSVKDICSMPIKDITTDNSVLFLWATFPNLPEAFKVIEAWGFKYKTLGFSWIKTNKKNGKPFFGIGYYTKSNCEVCLIATKGKLKPVSNSVSSVIIEPKQAHSQKPESARNRIVELYGDLPRVELFARQKVEGWDCWGNEVESDINFEEVK